MAAAASVPFVAHAQGKALRFRGSGRATVPRDTLPEPLHALLPWQGIYAAGGGLVSPSWRVVVTLDGELRAGSNAKPGSSSIAVLDKKKRQLDPATLKQVIALADGAWRDKREKKRLDPASNKKGLPSDVDYGELLVMVDGTEGYFFDAQGPIKGGAAETLVRLLQAEAAK